MMMGTASKRVGRQFRVGLARSSETYSTASQLPKDVAG
jgi:hypothetical protein